MHAIIWSLFSSCISCRHLNISTHLHASASHRVVKLISTSRSCMLLLNMLPSRLAASIPPYDNDSSGKKNRISAARRLSFTADDYFRAVESRIREKNSNPKHTKSLRNFINIQHIDRLSSIISPLFSSEIENYSIIDMYKLFQFDIYFSFSWK